MDDVYGVPEVEREMTHEWRTRKRYPERFGKRCRVLASQKRQLIVEFEDGFQVFARSSEVRRRKAENPVTEFSREILIQGQLREAVEVHELGVAIEVSWTDGRQFRGTVLNQGTVGGQRQAAKTAARRELRGGDE